MQVSTLKMLRQTHLYLGVFIAPAILFFAFTGALQTFSLHENAKVGNYKPARWIAVLAQIHKKQSSQLPPSKLQSSASPHADAHHKPEKHANAVAADLPRQNPLPLKIFFLLVCVGLFTSTFSGFYMSYKYSRNKLLLGMVFLAGIVAPIVLVFA
jgi:uncharacterized iron-regulated membrane protein